MTATRPVSKAPFSAVEQGICQMGTYNSAIRNVNLLQADNPLGMEIPTPLKSLRLKEWQAFQFDHADWFMCLAVYNTKSLGTAIIMAYHKPTQRFYRYERKVPFWQLKVPAGLFNTECYYHHKDLSIHIHNDLDNKKITLQFDAKNVKGCPDLSGHLTAHATTEPIVIVQPFDKNRPLYSHKALMPVEGHVYLNGQESVVNSHNSCLIVDDHKGYYPIKMQYDWLTALGHDDNGILQGFNLTDNQIQDHEKFNENCIWYKGKMYPLPPIKIERPEGVNNTWKIKDHDGQVDLTFTPMADVPLKVGIGIKLVDYHGPSGQVFGNIKIADGTVINFDGFWGMGEKKLIRM